MENTNFKKKKTKLVQNTNVYVATKIMNKNLMKS